MNRRTAHTGVMQAIALASLVSVCGQAAEMRVRLYGSIVGFVTGPAGAAQMGATVYLLNRYDQLIQRTTTNERGAFGFDALRPETYSVRVMQAAFAPASKAGVNVLPGERSFLSIQLASMISSIRLVGAAPGATSMMTDDWKWVLRSNGATRPVLRILPKPRIDAPGTARVSKPSVFSETQGLLRLSAGEAGSSQAASLGDMGTAFGLATSLFGSNRVMFSGNVGYSSASGVPAAGFRTAWRRHADGEGSINPEFRLTVQQVFMPVAAAGRFAGPSASSLPAMRTMSASMAEEVRFGSRVRAELGMSLDAVTFLSRVNYLSPYMLVSADLGRWGSLEGGFSSGLPPVERLSSRREETSQQTLHDLNRNVTALGLLPRVSLRGGAAQIQRSSNIELAYRKKLGAYEVSTGFFRESALNTAFTFAGDLSGHAHLSALANDLLPDFNSSSFVFNAGHLNRFGFSAAGSRRFGDWMTARLIVGRGGVLRTDQHQLLTNTADEIRSAIRRAVQNSITAQVEGQIPKAGTRYAAGYQWTDYRSLTPGHFFLTNVASAMPGLNLSFRQPVPALPILPGRFEISAEMRNLLAQGYLPLMAPDGRRLLLLHTPRMVRGGVSFFF